MGKNPAQKAKAVEAANKDKVVDRPARAKKVAKASAKAAPTAAVEACKIAKCKREYRAKGYCNVHYKKWKQGEFGLARYKTCKSPECRKPIVQNRHGFCEDHFQSIYVKGVAAPKPAAPAKEAKESKEAAA